MTRGLIRRDPGELPAEVTRFVGRQRELAVLDGLLGTARLVTVTGPGGVGKTRVALRAAAKGRGQFADGICLAELGGLHDPDLLPHTVATRLGPPRRATRSQAEVIRLCGRLDGIPRAIELAAVQLRTLTLPQLNSRLEHRFGLLTAGRRGALPHQQTLRATTRWSYDLCSAAEQLLWARLSVFAGSFDLAAAEAICAGGPLAREDILPTLIGLVDKSVVMRTEEDAGRYWLLDTIREFGAERLAERDRADADRTMDRHIGYFRA